MGLDNLLPILYYYPSLQHAQGLFEDNSRPVLAGRGERHPLLGYTHAQTQRGLHSLHNLGGRADGVLQEKNDP